MNLPLDAQLANAREALEMARQAAASAQAVAEELARDSHGCLTPEAAATNMRRREAAAAEHQAASNRVRVAAERLQSLEARAAAPTRTVELEDLAQAVEKYRSDCTTALLAGRELAITLAALRRQHGALLVEATRLGASRPGPPAGPLTSVVLDFLRRTERCEALPSLELALRASLLPPITDPS